MATATEAAILEQRAQLEAIALEHEGMRNYARLDIQSSTAQAMQLAIQDYDRRVALLGQAISHNEALMADGFPEIPMREVAQSILEDLQEEAEELNAALAKFSADQAVSLGLSAKPPEPK